MAAYKVTDFRTSTGSMATILAELETKLETLDSTTNPLIMSGIEQIGNSFIGYLIYTIA